MATRWGIASAGKISHDFTNALATLPQEEHQVVAIAARDLKRAEEFAKLYNIGKSYGSYEDLAKDADVEIVYVGNIHPEHLETAKMMLNHGKHVLCEKPLTINLKQTTELINFATSKGLFLMEGVWSRCFPAYEDIKKQITSGLIGDVKQVIVSFGFAMSDLERISKRNLGGGITLDLGIHTIQFSQFIYGEEKPISIKAAGHLNYDGVDQSMSATLSYTNGRTATIIAHTLVNLPNEAIVIGTKGKIVVPFPFWAPTKVEYYPDNASPQKVESSVLPTGPYPSHYPNSAGLRYEAMEVRACIKAGLTESQKVSHAQSLLFAELVDEVRRQIGVVYPWD